MQSAIDTLLVVMSDNSALPQWSPTRAGGVQLDWHESGVDLEIEFDSDPDEECGYAVFNDLNDEAADWSGPVRLNLERLCALLSTRLVRL